MSVPKWRQTVSKTQYLNLLYELNIKMGHIVNNAFDGDCGLGLGNEVSQIGAIFYPNKEEEHH